MIRASKYRHVFGLGSKRDQCYEGINFSLDSNDWHLAKASPNYLSLHLEAAGGGSFLIWPQKQIGRLPVELPLCSGHRGTVLDTDFSPFDEKLVASAGEDGRILLWKIPDDGFMEATSQWQLELLGHSRRIVDLAWHPTAQGVLASASHDCTVKIWDTQRAQHNLSLTGHADAIIDQAWNLLGDRLATACRDKSIHVWDPRASASKAVASKAQAHGGVKAIRLTWLGESDHRLLTTGFSRTSQREISLWDTRSLASPLAILTLDCAAGPLMPYFDADCGVLYVAGRGDGNVRYYELTNDDVALHYLSEYRSTDPQRSLVPLPKRAVNVAEQEIARFFKVYGAQPILEPVSFRVPRREQHTFQQDIYPDALAAEPALTAAEYFAGSTKPPRRVSLAKLQANTAGQTTSDPISNAKSPETGDKTCKSSIQQQPSQLSARNPTPTSGPPLATKDQLSRSCQNSSKSAASPLFEPLTPSAAEVAPPPTPTTAFNSASGKSEELNKLREELRRLVRDNENLKAELALKNLKIKHLETKYEKS